MGGALAAGAKDRLAGVLDSLRQGNLVGSAGQALFGTGKVGGMMGFQKKHRSMNPANIKALRRSMRRLEGFGKVVKRVHKMLPKLNLMPAQHHSRQLAMAGHKSGCKCVGCRNR